MIQALSQLGTKIRSTPNSLQIEPQALSGPAEIDCGLAGTVMRFVPPLAALVKGKVSFDGDAAARNRPMETTTDALRALGIKVVGDSLPFEVHGLGKVIGGELTIDASNSSQFVSGLLLAAPRFENGLTLTHVGDQLPSLPHIEMTLECLRNRGVQTSKISDVSWQFR
jgi:3-phosphoshikimate 1-carboxyvinyltransferase